MTTLEIAQLACEKVRHTDPATLALATRFTRARYAQIFNDHLWRDSLSAYAFILDPEGDAASPTGGNAALTALAVQGIYLLPPSVQRVLAVRSAGVGAVPWTTGTRSLLAHNQAWQGHDLSRYWLQDSDGFANAGTPAEFVAHGALVSLSLSNDTVTVGSSLCTVDGGTSVQVEWTDSLRNERATSTLTLPTGPYGPGLPDPTVTLGNAREILSVSHAALTGTLTLAVGADTIATVPAGATAAALRIPLEVFPKPTALAAFRVLAKRTPLPLLGTNDQPDIRGIERALLEYVTADVREWAGQVQTAQTNRAAGDAALMQLLATESVARPDNARMVPADGYGCRHGYEETHW